MIINNLEEFDQYVNSLFSCNYLSEKDKEKMKEAIDLAMESIPETDKKLKFICEYELERNSSSSVDDEKIIFCLKRLSQEKNKEIILKLCRIKTKKHTTEAVCFENQTLIMGLTRIPTSRRTYS